LTTLVNPALTRLHKGDLVESISKFFNNGLVSFLSLVLNAPVRFNDNCQNGYDQATQRK